MLPLPVSTPRAFTVIELLVVVTVIGVLSSFAAIGLTSRIPQMRVQARAATLVELLSAARQRALREKKTQKVRIHQTRRASDLQELFQDDDDQAYGTHQLLFSAPVEVWFQRLPAPATLAPTTVFPQLIKDRAYYDAGLPPTVDYVPMLTSWDYNSLPPLGMAFPRAMAALRLGEIVELESGVRVVAINGRPTFGSSPAAAYATSPWVDPIPSDPVPVVGSPPRAAAGYADTRDDRIADVTYTPEGVFSFAPRPPGGPPLADCTITFATRMGAVSLTPPQAITVTVDRLTGVPRL